MLRLQEIYTEMLKYLPGIIATRDELREQHNALGRELEALNRVIEALEGLAAVAVSDPTPHPPRPRER